jgi:hypothetical protein
MNIIKMYLVEIGWGGVDWIGLAQDMYKYGALVNAETNLWFHTKLENYRVAAQLVASRAALISIKLVS